MQAPASVADAAPAAPAVLGNFSWVVEGRVAGSAYPKGAPEAVVAELQRHGFKTVVDLTEHADAPLTAAKQAAGISAVQIAVEDYKAPSPAQMDAFAEVVADEANWPVLVHCRAGIGRTGTMLAVAVDALTQRGMHEPVADVVDHVRSLRKGSLEVAQQVTAFAAWQELQRTAKAGSA
jgi:atypical dual specificity phosphatase